MTDKLSLAAKYGMTEEEWEAWVGWEPTPPEEMKVPPKAPTSWVESADRTRRPIVFKEPVPSSSKRRTSP